MTTYTQNFHLKKPGQNDFYDIDDHNSNMDIIDEEFGNVNNKLKELRKTALHQEGDLSTCLVTVEHYPGMGLALIYVQANAETLNTDDSRVLVHTLDIENLGFRPSSSLPLPTDNRNVSAVIDYYGNVYLYKDPSYKPTNSVNAAGIIAIGKYSK